MMLANSAIRSSLWPTGGATVIALALVAGFASDISAQQFRQPRIPQIDNPLIVPGSGQLQGRATRNDLGQSDGFVPKGSNNNSFGTVPVRPRSGAVVDGDSQNFGARSIEQERILESIRRGRFADGEDGFERQNGPQVIRKRYDNGRDHLVRQVVQDDEGNFYNHGPWQLFNRRGDVMASGQFAEGLMEGTWEHWHMGNAGGIFATKPFIDFEGPFLSIATFNKGKLDGVWVISDRNRRKIVEVPYEKGRRNGNATWWYPSSNRMRVISFKDGAIDGPFYEWDEENKLVRNDEFIEGRKVVRQRTMYRPNQPSSETYFLDAELTLETQDNWWDAEPADYIQLGQQVQHGPTFAWHENGQRQMVGQYDNGTRVGRFTWWHENGQRSLTGRYDEQGNKTGRWVWWHATGMKSIDGQYNDDETVQKWTWWNEDGSVKDRQDFGESPESNGVLAEPLRTDEEEQPQPQSEGSEGRISPPSAGIGEMEEISPLNLDENDLDNGGIEDDAEEIQPPKLTDPFDDDDVDEDEFDTLSLG